MNDTDLLRNVVSKLKHVRCSDHPETQPKFEVRGGKIAVVDICCTKYKSIIEKEMLNILKSESIKYANQEIKKFFGKK